MGDFTIEYYTDVNCLVTAIPGTGRSSRQLSLPLFRRLYLAISTDNEWLCNRRGDTVLDSLIFGGRGRDCVTDVWSAGRHVVKDGRHVARDTVVGAFRRAMAELGQGI